LALHHHLWLLGGAAILVDSWMYPSQLNTSMIASGDYRAASHEHSRKQKPITWAIGFVDEAARALLSPEPRIQEHTQT
jgi:hypothetical protein